jgi:hypothetical protein
MTRELRCEIVFTATDRELQIRLATTSAFALPSLKAANSDCSSSFARRNNERDVRMRSQESSARQDG